MLCCNEVRSKVSTLLSCSQRAEGRSDCPAAVGARARPPGASVAQCGCSLLKALVQPTKNDCIPGPCVFGTARLLHAALSLCASTKSCLGPRLRMAWGAQKPPAGKAVQATSLLLPALSPPLPPARPRQQNV